MALRSSRWCWPLCIADRAIKERDCMESAGTYNASIPIRVASFDSTPCRVGTQTLSVVMPISSPFVLQNRQSRADGKGYDATRPWAAARGGSAGRPGCRPAPSARRSGPSARPALAAAHRIGCSYRDARPSALPHTSLSTCSSGPVGVCGLEWVTSRYLMVCWILLL